MNLLASLRFLKFTGKMYAVYPLDANTNKLWCLIYDYLGWFYLINCFIAASVAIFTSFHAGSDFTVAGFAFMEAVSIAEAIIILINYKCNRHLLQFLLIQTEEYITTNDPKRQSYLKEKSGTFGIMLMMITSLFGVLVILYYTNPAITSWDSFLTTSYYPPSIRSPFFDVLIYFNQTIVITYASVMVNTDAVIVLIIYVSTVRLKILADNFQATACFEELRKYILEHQFMLCLTEKINKAARMVLAKTVICFIGYTVGAGLQIINPNASTATLHRFAVVLLINYLRLIMTAMSADDLSSVSKDVGFSIYSTVWYNENKDMILLKTFIMFRCQKLPKIYVSGIMTTLNLPFITGIISTSISYFTTLRAVTNS